MAKTIDVSVPDIGDFADVPVIDVLVAPGDRVEAETPLVTLESDKATMDVPSPQAGTVKSIGVSVGDRVSEGSALLTLEVEGGAGDDAGAAGEAPAAPGAERGTGDDAPERRAGDDAPERRAGDDAPAPTSGGAPAAARASADIECDTVVLGAGPGGYTAAFRSADLGRRTVLIERYPTLGGVCLNVGCIPSKALLHTAEVISATRAMADHGVEFGEPRVDPEKLSAWKDKVVAGLTKGLAGLARQRKVEVVQGTGRFASANTIEVETAEGTRTVAFESAIIAAGSQATRIPAFPNDDPRVMDSTDALVLDAIPKRMLVVGGGIIGLEMATVYAALGTRITVVELMDGLIPGCDRDLVKPLHKRIEGLYEAILLGTKVSAVEARDDGLKVAMEGPDGTREEVYDRVLVAVGRRPNGDRIGADRAGVHVDDAGFVPADRQQRTNVAHIFSIGDIAGQPMLAHKATHEGKVAAEVAAGEKSGFDALAIPSVAYTDPEVAWTGLTETEAKARGIEVEKASFPWAASGRALGMGRGEGVTKVLFDPQSGRLLGAGMVGPHAGDLVAEATLAIEMGADAQDIGLTIHPHPTLSETFNFAAEMVEGTITDLYVPKKKKKG